MKITLKMFSCALALAAGVALGAVQAQTSPQSQTGKVSVDAQKETAVKHGDGKAANVPPLSEEQKKSLMAIKVESGKKAAPVALRFAGIVKQVYENMLADKPDEALRAKLSAEMKEAGWELLSIKGQSIFEMAAILTPEQKRVLMAEMKKPDATGDLGELIEKTFKLGKQ